MTHLWVRAESRENETRVGLTPAGAVALMKAGVTLTVEASSSRCIPTEEFAATGANIAPEGSWPDAPKDAFIFGLKELPDADTPLPHRHIMFGHAFKGQPAGQRLLARFKAGGGALFDLEYLLDENDRRVAAFGYWAGYAGAAVTLKCWLAQQHGKLCGPVREYPNAEGLLSELQSQMDALGVTPPRAIVIGAQGRVGTGASDLCAALGVPVTGWDIAETAHGGPFPEILDHELFLNCILARPGTPVFVPADTGTADRKLSVIGDIACDPESDFSPIKVYDRTTSWEVPALRVHEMPPLDVTAIDNLPAMLPRESSEDFAGQLLPSLMGLLQPKGGVWAKAFDIYAKALAQV